MFFEEKGIYNKNKISFVCDGVKYNIKYFEDEVIMVREGNDFINAFIFNDKISKCSYTLKDHNYTIDMSVKVMDMEIKDNSIFIKYIIIDTDSLYEYKIEVSDYL